MISKKPQRQQNKINNTNNTNTHTRLQIKKFNPVNLFYKFKFYTNKFYKNKFT